MGEPLVCAVMLTRDRPEMAMRAVTSFRNQTYQNKKLIIVNGNLKRIIESDIAGILEPDFVDLEGMTIGDLRNLACRYASAHYAASSDRPEIFVHFDDDDYSHPRRIEEQIALLVASGKECVGYNEMLFWDTFGVLSIEENTGRAWLFQNKSPNYALGTSLCYWRSTWEKHPFPDKMRGEDFDFVYGCDSVGYSSVVDLERFENPRNPKIHQDFDPRMIASIHAGNGVRVDPRAPHHWTRATQFDDWCRKAMAL